jgi:hypothetical protein
MLNEADLLEGRRFDDAVAYGGWHIDNHVGLFKFDEIPSFVYEVPGSYDIPYRSYCVKGFENLFVGGRCFGASKLAMASARVMGTCAIGGQAIGTAAAQLIRNGEQNVRAIDVSALQENLLRDDCYLPGRRSNDRGDLIRTARIKASSAKEGFPPEAVANGISRRENGSENAWHSDGIAPHGERLILELKDEKKITSVQITFDSNFDLEKKITLSSRRQKQQVEGIPQELVREFSVTLWHYGEPVADVTVKDNCQRFVRIPFSAVECDAITVTVRSTNGAPDARIFEVRAYGK